MILPSDKEYKITKQIMLGKATMNSDFIQLANFIDQTFGVKTINIIYDTIDKEKRPRLNICFEFENEKQSFNENGEYCNFDIKKQKIIADKFKESLINQKIIKKGFFGFFNNHKDEKYKTENVWVYFSAFEPLAKIETSDCVPQNQIDQLKKELNNDELWGISKGFSQATFFLYSDEQVKRYENSEIQKLWAEKYFNLLKPYDEFDYFKREKFYIYLDSKENFDNNYESNWYYYYK